MPRKVHDPTDIERVPNSEDATYTVENAWSMRIYPGTRCAVVHRKIARPTPYDNAATRRARREIAQQIAMHAAVAMWQNRWGTISWDLVQFTVSHTTIAVLVEIRVGNV